MNGGAQGGFGGTALAQAFENALHIAHAIRIVNVRDGRQTFGVGDRGLHVREACEASLQQIQGNVLLCLEEQGEWMTISAELLGLEKLSDALIQPGRTASAGKTRNEGVSQFMFENAGQFGRN